MIEVVTNNATVTTNNSIPLQTIVFQKGCAIKRSGTSAFKLNPDGVYRVTVNVVANSATATTGTVSIQIAKNGNLVGIPSTETVDDATSLHTLSTSALIYAPSACCCSDANVITVQNVGNDAVVNMDIIVTKVC